jgi:hypothetical protein
VNEIEMDKVNLDIEIVKMTIKSLKSKILCGFGGVPAELLKPTTGNLHELLRQIFERCLNGDEIPTDWKIKHISTIYKKERRKNMETTGELHY